MWNPFKKKTVVTPVKEVKWTYGICMDDVPDNPYNIGSTHCLTHEVNSNIPFPRIGETVMISDDIHTDLRYTGIVSEIFYNYDLHWIVITCKCTEAEIIKKK